MLAPSMPPVGRPRVLDDGPKADVWLGLMEKQGAIHELMVFFYDSPSGMMSWAEFFGL